MLDPTLYTKVIEELEQARAYANLAKAADSPYERKEREGLERAHRALAMNLLKEAS